MHLETLVFFVHMSGVPPAVSSPKIMRTLHLPFWPPARTRRLRRVSVGRGPLVLRVRIPASRATHPQDSE